MNEIVILNGLEELYPDKPFIQNLKRAAQAYDLNYDFLSKGQIQSKNWLLGNIRDVFLINDIEPHMVYIMGGWYAHLADMFFNKFPEPDWDFKIHSFDIDPSVAEIAETLNRTWVMDGWRFKATTKDIFDIDLNEHKYNTLRRDGTSCELTEQPDLVINTSGEHIDLEAWWEQVPEGMLCAIQSNNFLDGDGHINCVNSVEELMDQIPMGHSVNFAGTLDLEQYERYMVIGRK